jgi:curved DNA-binding protein CbpA
MAEKLAEYPLAELIREFSIANLSGALRLENERVKVVIYFEDGEVVYAASNVREFRLSEYLKKHNLVSEQQLAAFGNNKSDTALAAFLNTQGVLDQFATESVLSAVVSDILRLTLSWKEGSWEYDNQARLADSTRVRVDTSSLLIEASRRFEPTFVLARFPNPDEEIAPVTAGLGSARLLPAEGFVLSRLEQPLSLSELITLSGLGATEALQTIYGLILAGYIKRQSFPLILKRSATTKRPTPKPAPAPPPPPVAELKAPALNEEEELKIFFNRMGAAKDHYAVLDLDRSAAINEIKRSYYSLARRYHPDRFHAKAEIHNRVESAFARITQAYETLTHPKQKSAYDLKLAAQEKAQRIAEAAPQRATPTGVASDHTSPSGGAEDAERRFREGFAALEMGQPSVAIPHLAAAAQAAPREARYRAYYGKALATNSRSQKMAEAELQAALKLDPQNATYRVMLAELFFHLTFYRRALTEVERAIQLDPNNQEARALLKKLPK